MALSHVELYEALKGAVSEEAARLIAEVVPPAADLATRDYIDAKVAELRGDVRSEIHLSGKEHLRWMIGLFIPVWAGTWVTFIAILLKS